MHFRRNVITHPAGLQTLTRVHGERRTTRGLGVSDLFNALRPITYWLVAVWRARSAADAAAISRPTTNDTSSVNLLYTTRLTRATAAAAAADEPFNGSQTPNVVTRYTRLHGCWTRAGEKRINFTLIARSPGVELEANSVLQKRFKIVINPHKHTDSQWFICSRLRMMSICVNGYWWY